MKELRFAILGTGFWSRYQLAGWQELPGARCVALFNRTRNKAELLAREFGVPAVYDDVEELLEREPLDFVDIITQVGAHEMFVRAAAQHRLPVICQKPMAPTLEAAERMVATCRDAGVPFFVHENWRWQTPIRALLRVLQEGVIGQPFRARISYNSNFPVLENQPALADLERFILADIGSHLLDTARALFGEAATLFCQTHRIQPQIRGEDVATVMMQMQSGMTLLCEMSYASRLEQESFPQTLILVEGEDGSAELARDYWLRVTTYAGTTAQRYPPPHYAWADPAYELVQSSIVACNADLLSALHGQGPAETTGEDNLKTMRLVFAAYDSAASGEVIPLRGD